MLVDLETIQKQIYEIRGRRVMLDVHLAAMYQVPTKRLKEQVRRNIERFPDDFMFELSKDEFQYVVAICDHILKFSHVAPFAFTQEGVAMLSGVLRSDIAIDVNIAVMRAFVRMRTLASQYAELKRQLEEYQMNTSMQIEEILIIINELSEQRQLENKPRNPIGFRAGNTDTQQQTSINE
jgi:hypothetical protein